MPANSTGEQIWVGWIREVTPGTPLAATAYIPAEPGTTKAKPTTGRKPVQIVAGTPRLDRTAVDTLGMTHFTTVMKAYVTLGKSFLTELGYGSSGIVVPTTYLTVTIDGGEVAWQYPGTKSTATTWSDSATMGGLQISTACVSALAAPVKISSIAGPALTATTPYSFANLGSVTLPGGTGSAQVLDYSFTCATPQAMGPTNTGKAYYGLLVNSSVSVSGSIRLQLDTTDFAEMTAYLAANGTQGALNLIYTLGANSLTINFPNINYMDGEVVYTNGQINVIQLSWSAMSTTAAQFVTFTYV